jgi:hypothetical protein
MTVDGWEFSPPIVANDSDSYAVRSVVWPGIGVYPFGEETDFHAVCTYGSGYARREPHRNTGLVSVSPDNPAYVGFYDAETKACLMLEARDDTYRLKTFTCQSNPGTGDGAFVYVELRHYADRRFAVATSWGEDYDYVVRLTSFTGRTQDGRLCAYDFAEKYAEWAALDARPWNRRGKWKDAPTFPAPVRETTLHITYSRPFDATNHPTAITRWRTLVGPFAEPIVCHYGWSNKVFDTQNPNQTFDGPVTTAVKNWVTDAQTNGWAVMAYWLGRFWESAIPAAGWNPSSYTQALTPAIPDDLRPYFMHRPDGELRTLVGNVSGNVTTFLNADFIHRDVWERLLPDAYEKAVVDVFDSFQQPQALYIDAHGTQVAASTATGTDASDNDDDPDEDATWNYPDYYRGYVASFEALATKVGIGQYGNALFTEWPSELNVSTVSLMTNNASFTNLGVGLHTLPCIYGDRVRFTTFGVGVVTNSITQGHLNSYLISREWLASGIVQINDGTSDALNVTNDPVLIYATLTDSPLYYMLIWCKKLSDLYTAVARDYFEGRLTRPLVADWKGAFVSEQPSAADADGTLSTWLIFGGILRYPVLSETWRRENGDVGIMVLYPYPHEDDILPAHVGFVPVLADETLTISLDTTRDGLPPGPKKVYKNANGTRSAALATFTGSTTLTVVVEPFEAFVLEIVPA